MAQSIKDILDSLPEDKVRTLMYAFDNRIPQFVDLPDGRYIGVHVSDNRKLIPELTTDNGWSTGLRTH